MKGFGGTWDRKKDPLGNRMAAESQCSAMDRRRKRNYSWSSCIVNQLKGQGVVVKISLRSICSAKCSGQKSRMTLGYLNIHFMRWWKYYGAIYYTSDDTSSSSVVCSFQFCCPHLEDINQVQRVQEEMLESWKISILEQTARAIPTLDKKLGMEKE